jgi:AcrR family transcriptional regulator
VSTHTKQVPEQAGTGNARAGPEARSSPFAAPRADQRERLLAATVEIVSRDGYPSARIGDIARRAGVSRATFYELFSSKEACLLDAQRELAEQLRSELDEAVAAGDAAAAAQSALTALVRFAEGRPSAFAVLMHEAMLAGPEAQAERDHLVSHAEHSIEQAWEQAPSGPQLDMSPKLLFEGTTRLLGRHMRHDGGCDRQMLGALLDWIDSYTVSAPPARWRELDPSQALLSAAGERGSAASGAPRSLPKGRHRLGADVVSSVQRERIAYGTAEAIRARGYANLTVADIVASAGLSRDVFYAHFHDKDEAVEATVQLVFEQLLAAMAGAFFGHTGGWPEQIWAAGHAFVGYLEDNPTLAHFLFVATYTPPDHIERVEDFVLAFTLFIEPGNSYRPENAPVPRIAIEAIVCVVLEAVSFQIRHERVGELRGLIPIITYMVFAPFMGTRPAAEFVFSQIQAAQVEAP